EKAAKGGSDNIIGGVSKGTGKIKVTSELENHIKYTDSTVPRKRGIGGAHNADEFLKNDIQIVSTKPNTNIKGVETVEYQLSKLDKTGTPIPGEYQSGKPFSKTIYDPKIISDETYMKRGIEAANNALSTSTDGTLPRIWSGVDKQGVAWRGYYEDGVITSFYPE
ncbi:CdiA family toxin C-terminal domain-containing protein, partial [Aminipila sp.]|uniref:CdiA family toxin C-terminal domain-containing protein n=1 Tax=Aminipila sp. TaxID=2060095 RepID=UPI00289F953B